MIKFGPSGNSTSFYDEGHKSTIETAKWLSERGLDAFEYSFGRGVSVSKNTALEINAKFKEYGIAISAHAPYYINFANPDDALIEKSVGYVTSTADAVAFLGGNRVVVHPATLGKMTKEAALSLTLENIRKLKDILEERGYNDTIICFESMGRPSQIGSIDDIIEICALSDRFYPCFDFGHINSREQGILNNPLNYNTIFYRILDSMPFEKVNNMHIHFSKIEFGAKGELRHLTFVDTVYGPPYEPLMELLYKHNLNPYVICESNGTQAEDAGEMKRYYQTLSN